jgi:predicted transcriptional regulator
MSKPKGIQWLEEQTGARLDYEHRTVAQERHLSVRLSDDLANGLDSMAAERSVTVSHLVRDLLTEVLAQRQAVASLDAKALADRLAADAAELRRRLAG